jgi:hypothetical protein
MSDAPDTVDLPDMPDAVDARQLIDIMKKAAAYRLYCEKALKLLFALTSTERAEFPDYLDYVESARLGMSAGRQRQEQAAVRLNRLASYGDTEAIEFKKTGPRGPTLG